MKKSFNFDNDVYILRSTAHKQSRQLVILLTSQDPINGISEAG